MAAAEIPTTLYVPIRICGVEVGELELDCKLCVDRDGDLEEVETEGDRNGKRVKQRIGRLGVDGDHHLYTEVSRAIWETALAKMPDHKWDIYDALSAYRKTEDLAAYRSAMSPVFR